MSRPDFTAAIQQIYDCLQEQFDHHDLWVADPSEDNDLKTNKSFYFGAAGTIWLLHRISQHRGWKSQIDLERAIDVSYQHYLNQPDTGTVVPSYFLGEAGILQVKVLLQDQAKDRARLFEVIRSNLDHPCCDALWGTPGTMVPAWRMFERTQDQAWLDLYIECARSLMRSFKYNEEADVWYWEYQQNGNTVPFIGAGHGFIGNCYSLLIGLEHLPHADKTLVLERLKKQLKRFANPEGSGLNWPATFFGPKGTDRFMHQWCHGAPGVIQSLARFDDPSFDELLLGAGECVYEFGPLKKGVGLCHGTDGNGLSLLMLYQRTGDAVWLDRAYQFARHALDQKNGRSTLYTGEAGLAFFLDCFGCDQVGFPGLDIL